LFYLIIVSIIWAFSFSLIKTFLTGFDAQGIALIRLTLSFLVFLPFLKRVPLARVIRQSLIGVIQFGVMYVLYIQSYQYLKGHQIAILTISTPVFVILFDAVIARAWKGRYWLAVVFVLSGSVLLIPFPAGVHMEWKGVLLVQLANACFAAGQILQKTWGSEDLHHYFGWSFLGALCVPLVTLSFRYFMNPDILTILFPVTVQAWFVLVYLGVISSGLAFYMWNKGICTVNAGVISVMNNLKIPLAVLVSLFLFHESVELGKLLLSTLCFTLAVYLSWKDHPGGC
jgi:drug/metabolite transporter (DMT)-like permease